MLTKLLKMLNNIRQNRKKHISKKSILESSFIPISNKPRIKKKMKDEVDLEQAIKHYDYRNHFVVYNPITKDEIGHVVNEVFDEQKPIIEKPIVKEKNEQIKKVKDLDYNIDDSSRRIIDFPLLNGYSNRIEIIKYPTNNCQLSSLSTFVNILYIDPLCEKHVFKLINYHTCRQVIIDIKINYANEMEKFLKKYMDIVIKTPYNSTNGSNMVLYIYKWKTDLNFENE